MIASIVPDTVRFISLTALCSSEGFTTNSPSTLPILTEPVGPSHGISEIERATDEPIIAAISDGQSLSTHITVATTTTSL